MKKILAYLLPLLVLAACGKQSENSENSENSEHSENSESSEPVEHSEHFEAIPLAQGRTAIRILALAPMNEMVWWNDSLKRPLAVYSRASECEAQVVNLAYDKDGRIESVGKTLLDATDDAYCENLDSLLDAFVKLKPYAEYKFAYGADGTLQSVVIDSEDADTCIHASKGSHLVADIRPVVSYWASDLHGGLLFIYIEEVADADTAKVLGSWINGWPVANYVEYQLEDFFYPLGNTSPQTMPEEYDYYPRPIPIK